MAVQQFGRPRLGYHGYDWPHERSELLRQYWNIDKLSASQIGAKFGITRNAVIGRARRMGLDHRTTAPRIIKDQRDKPRVAPIRKPPPEVVLAVIEQLRPPIKPGKRVSLYDLTNAHCHWPIGEPAELMFCGAHKADNGPYCPAHARQAYKPG
jgi:hypothetical protein